MAATYPPLLSLPSEQGYRDRFHSVYCRKPVGTFDGIDVRFRRSDFDHAFYESTRGQKDNVLSTKRAQRIDWIRAALQDPGSERYLGWDRKTRTYTNKRRVCIVMGDYVVVIRLTGVKKAQFVTAFVADTPSRPGRPSTVQQIRRGPKWGT